MLFKYFPTNNFSGGKKVPSHKSFAACSTVLKFIDRKYNIFKVH